jgi:hypothetical protein
MNRITERALSSPVYGPLRVHGGSALDLVRPDLDDLQRLFDRRDPAVQAASGWPLRIVGQGARPAVFEDKYEARLFLRGELQVRRDHWHDCFNALVWLAYPKAKAALNARHFKALQAQHAAGMPNRGPAQDALTLFDEGGVIMVSAERDLLQMVRDFRWKDLFWASRERLRARARFFLFGHALYEKMLRPFRGITGRCLLLDGEPGLLSAPLPEQLAAIDARAAHWLSDPARFVTTRELAVLPVLGVPGWHEEGESEGFYDDAEYFRPGRRVRETGNVNRKM